jgi:biofilm protein TabA
MRKIAFVIEQNKENIKKVMIYKSDSGVNLFGYDTVLDCNGLFDEWYENLKDAEMSCEIEYGIKSEDWILIPDPQDFCNYDYIMPVRIKGRDIGKPEFDTWEILRKGKWEFFQPPYELNGTALTGNEMLFFSGLLDEFDKAKKRNKTKARKILKGLRFDSKSIEKILL